MSRIASYDFRFGRMILRNKLITTFLGRTMEMFLHLRSPSYLPYLTTLCPAVDQPNDHPRAGLPQGEFNLLVNMILKSP
jgi:hypothetical protein